MAVLQVCEIGHRAINPESLISASRAASVNLPISISDPGAAAAFERAAVEPHEYCDEGDDQKQIPKHAVSNGQNIGVTAYSPTALLWGSDLRIVRRDHRSSQRTLGNRTRTLSLMPYGSNLELQARDRNREDPIWLQSS